MFQTGKIPDPVDPQAMPTTSGHEAWRVPGIMAEFTAAAERLRGFRPTRTERARMPRPQPAAPAPAAAALWPARLLKSSPSMDSP